MRKAHRSRLIAHGNKSGVTKFISLSSFFIAIWLYGYMVIWLPCFAAEEATPTVEIEETQEAIPSPKKEQLEKIRNLKEKVAETVAEQRKKNRRAYFGKIKEISDSTIILTTKKEEATIIIAEETNIYKVGIGGRKKIDLDDLKEAESITALGIAEKEGELTPKIIIVKQKPVIIHGKVIEIDTGEGTITVATKKNGEFLVDYETTTKCKIFEKAKGLVKCGLSEIEVDDRVHIVGTKDENNDARLTALRVLVLPGKALGIVGKEEPSLTLSPSPAETE